MKINQFLNLLWVLFRLIQCTQLLSREILINYLKSYQQSIISKSNNLTYDELYSVSIEAEYPDRRKDECWIPYSSIIITCTNEYHFPLILLQIEGLKLSGLWSCLKSNYHGK